MEKYCVMNIGIDIDGVLTNDDDYILDFTSKYCYEHGLKGFDNANLYENNCNRIILKVINKRLFFPLYLYIQKTYELFSP